MTPREILINKQNFVKTQIKDFEKQIEIRESLIDMLEQAIDAIDMAEHEEFKKELV
jgi:hypothetical protein